MNWKPIAELPADIGKRMFVVRAEGVVVGTTQYTSDPYCVFKCGDKYMRWPHTFQPNQFLLLPE